MRKAIEHDQATLEISREIGDRRIEGNALGALGLAYTDLGEVGQAMDIAAGVPSIRHYFVDESGDGVLFNRKGRVVVGAEGCSRFFILGLVDIPAPDILGRELYDLRTGLLADPYFKGVPSIQPEPVLRQALSLPPSD